MYNFLFSTVNSISCITPMPIAQMEQEFPEAYAEFLKVCETLENHYHDMQDMEFTG